MTRDAMVAAPRTRGRGRLLGWSLAAAILAVFAGANAHLVAVAVDSQPDCVPHLDHPTQGAGFRAASSSC